MKQIDLWMDGEAPQFFHDDPYAACDAIWTPV